MCHVPGFRDQHRANYSTLIQSQQYPQEATAPKVCVHLLRRVVTYPADCCVSEHTHYAVPITVTESLQTISWADNADKLGKGGSCPRP